MGSWRCQEQQVAFLQEARSMLATPCSLGKRNGLWNYRHEESWRRFTVNVTILWCLRFVTAVCKAQSRNQWELSLLSSRPPATLTWGCWAAIGSSRLSQETFTAAAKLHCSKIFNFSSSWQDQRNHAAAPIPMQMLLRFISVALCSKIAEIPQQEKQNLAADIKSGHFKNSLL